MLELFMVFGIIALVIALLAGEAWLVMWGWNFFMAGMLGLPVISFWPAFGLMVVCNILFKSRTTVNKD